MINKFNSVYTMCVELSKKSDSDSINKLVSYYLTANKNGQNTAKTALKKTKNKKCVLEVLDDHLKSTTSLEERLQLLRLGISIRRQHYLYDYLHYLCSESIDFKLIGFFQNIMELPLDEPEKDEIKRYIVDKRNFDPRLFSLVGARNTEELLDCMLDHIIENGVSEEMLKILTTNKEYLGLLQAEIRNSILSNPEANVKLARYLDFTIGENQALLASYNNVITIYGILKSRYVVKFQSEYFCIRVPMQILNKEQIVDTDWEILKKIIFIEIEETSNINDKELFLDFLWALTYHDYTFIENTLISLYKDTRLYSNKVLGTLARIKSNYAYREMVSFMLTSEDRKERYKYAVKLIKTYPQKAMSIYEYAKDLSDQRLLDTLETVTMNCNIQTEIVDFNSVTLDHTKKIQILPHGIVISEFLFELAQEINADRFYAAVGFTFSSGLKMIYPLLNYMRDHDGCIELISGSLQNFNVSKNTKIDKKTVVLLNNLIKDFNFDLYTYEDAFYHGKFYYLGNENKAYVIIGSSNLSKTAYLGNYELDILFELDVNSEQAIQFKDWYDNFKSQCTHIDSLDEEKFEELNWESELDIYSSQFVYKMSYVEVNNKITALTDEDTKYRLNTWMSYTPTEIISNLGINALSEYIIFLYAERGLAVFESFLPGNAYYTFKYYDFEQLLNHVSALTKSQMLLSSSFVNRGYHIHDRDKLENKISKLFK